MRPSPAGAVAAFALSVTVAVAVVAAAAAAAAATTSTGATTARATPTGPSAGGIAAVMRLLGAQAHRRTAFRERQDLAVLDRPLISTGELIYDAPGRLEERLITPHREVLVAQGDRLSVERGGRRRVLELAHANGLAALIGSLRATLAGDDAALQRDFRVDFRGGVARWTLRLTPRSAALARHVTAIRIDGARGELRRVVIRAANGDSSVMRLADPAR